MEKQNEELMEMCKPIAEYLQKHFHPHVSVSIEGDRIRVEETIAGCPVGPASPMDTASKMGEYRRFESIAKDDNERAAFEDLIKEKQLNRKDLALILFSLRVRRGFHREDFGI